MDNSGYIALGLLFYIVLSSQNKLDSVSDDDLINLFKKETHVLVLFSKTNCDDCVKYENLLYKIKDELKETLDADVVKAYNSQMVRLYSPTKEPALVYFRHGVPLLYNGPINEDSILTQLSQSKEPFAKELTDEIFEHLTQASTGSTTGDWFVMFYTQECVDCQRLSAIWEAVGLEIKSRVNIARVNKGTLGAATAKRFNIKKVPEFILIRHGKFYRYEITKYDVKSLVSFAQEWYKNATPEKIEKPSSPFDNVVDLGVIYLKKFTTLGNLILNGNPNMLMYVSGGVALIILLIIISKCRSNKKTTKPKAQNKQKKQK